MLELTHMMNTRSTHKPHTGNILTAMVPAIILTGFSTHAQNVDFGRYSSFNLPNH
ncbi:MAG: hypothetical protein Q8O72_17245 [Bacteroidales bacterium]|jgi:hypothetical protein|nr:hypothetical protein [Bacteroidales bacterium]